MDNRHDRTRTRASRRGRRWLGLLALPLLLALTGFGGTTPRYDSFYSDPVNLTGASPGQVLRSRSSIFSLDPITGSAVAGTRAWQMVYRSTSALGAANAVSGTVIVPTTPWIGFTPRPVVGVAVGTRGLGDHCAPSYTLSNGTDYEGLFVQGLLAKGWAVVVTDYEGLGMPGNHPYMVGQSAGRALLDAVRAAERLPGTGLSGNSPVGLMGYSQGGSGSAWAGQLAPSYAPELKIKGISAGGVPADLAATAEHEDGGPVLAFTLMAAMGLDSAYPELHLSDYLNDKGRELLAESGQTCLVTANGIETIFNTAFRSRADYTTTDPLAAPAWKARLEENKLGANKPTAPVYQFHGVVDEMVPYAPAATLRRTWCNKGANVTWAPMVGEHISTMVTGYPTAVSWLQARFNGIPTFGNCWVP